MSACTSPIHPDGCSIVHRSPDGSCCCDCHSEVVRCSECGDEFHDDMVGLVLDRLLCATCVAELVAEARQRIDQYVAALAEQVSLDDSTLIATIYADSGHRRDLLLWDVRLLAALVSVVDS